MLLGLDGARIVGELLAGRHPPPREALDAARPDPDEAARIHTATVRAGVVDGVEAPLQIEDSDLLPRHRDTLRLTWREFGGTRDLDELRHVNLLLRSELDHDPARHDH